MCGKSLSAHTKLFALGVYGVNTDRFCWCVSNAESENEVLYRSHFFFLHHSVNEFFFGVCVCAAAALHLVQIVLWSVHTQNFFSFSYPKKENLLEKILRMKISLSLISRSVKRERERERNVNVVLKPA